MSEIEQLIKQNQQLIEVIKDLLARLPYTNNTYTVSPTTNPYSNPIWTAIENITTNPCLWQVR